MKLVLLIAALIPSTSFAGAWVQKEKGGQGILTFRYQDSNPEKFEVNPLLEWGATRDLTVGANLGYRAIDRSTGKSGLGYAEGYGRYQLWRGKQSVLSAQFMGGSAARGLDARANSASATAEGRLLWGAGFGLGAGGEGYVNAEGAYRTFFGKAGGELRSELSFGWKFRPGWIALIQGFHTENLRSDHQRAAHDYDSTQGQLSLVAPLGSRWQVQGGWNKTVGGQNVRYDSNYFLGLWFGW